MPTFALLLVLSVCCLAQPSVSVYTAAGEQVSAIEPTVRAFREDLGELNPNEPRPFPTGRREINWDGIGSNNGNDEFPGDFFVNSRGLLMSTPGVRLKVSGDQGTPSFLLGDVTLDRAGTSSFEPFSGQKIFAPLGSTTTNIEFRLIGGGWQQACTNGFGAVFLDVGRGGQSYIEANLTDGTTRKVMVPVQNVRVKGMSFAGIRVTNGCILSVRIVSGDQPVDTKQTFTPAADLVALDDFIYGEPHIPTRSSAAPNPY